MLRQPARGVAVVVDVYGAIATALLGGFGLVKAWAYFRAFLR